MAIYSGTAFVPRKFLLRAFDSGRIFETEGEAFYYLPWQSKWGDGLKYKTIA